MQLPDSNKALSHSHTHISLENRGGSNQNQIPKRKEVSRASPIIIAPLQTPSTLASNWSSKQDAWENRISPLSSCLGIFPSLALLEEHPKDASFRISTLLVSINSSSLKHLVPDPLGWSVLCQLDMSYSHLERDFKQTMSSQNQPIGKSEEYFFVCGMIDVGRLSPLWTVSPLSRRSRLA